MSNSNNGVTPIISINAFNKDWMNKELLDNLDLTWTF